MSIEELLSDLHARGIRVSLEGDRVWTTGRREALTPELVATLRQRRGEIIEFLEGGQVLAEPGTTTRGGGRRIRVTPAQKDLWLHWQVRGGDASYNLSRSFDVEGPLDVDRLREAFRRLVARHEILRSVYVPEEEGLFLELLPLDAFEVEVGEARDESAALEAATQSAVRPFDLRRGPLARCSVHRVRADRHVLTLCLHHIVADGHSLGILVRDLADFYSRPEARLPAVELPFAEVALRYPASSGEDLEYWTRELQGLLPLPFPARGMEPPAQPDGVVTLDLAPDLRRALENRCRELACTPFGLCLSGFSVLLWRYFGSSDFAVGIPVSRRELLGAPETVGYLVQMMPLRVRLQPDSGIPELVAQVARSVSNTIVHSSVSLGELVRAVPQERSAATHPFFQVAFSEEIADGGTARLGEAVLRPLELPVLHAKFDLSLFLLRHPGRLALRLEYRRAVMSDACARRFVANLRTLLGSVGRDGSATLRSLRFLAEDERRRLLDDLSGTAHPYSGEATISAAFERVASLRPNAVAVRDGRVSISYGDLARHSDRIAAALSRRGIRLGDFVGIDARHGWGLIAGVLGILKSGCAYVPLDPALPPARLDVILQDTAVRCILVTRGDGFPTSQGIPCLPLETALAEEGAPGPIALPASAAAYVNFTSGSTGRPKGVVATHRGVLRLVTAPDYVQLSEETVMLVAAPAHFDASTFETWGALLNGGKCVVLGEEVPTCDSVARAIREEGVNTAWLTSGLFHALAEADAACFSGLRYLLVGGDVVSPRHVTLVQEAVRDLRVINGYGPTENTTFSACHPIPRRPASAHAASLPIGRSIAGSSAYVLDDRLELAPQGSVGELSVGGSGLAQGYLRRPALTAQRFVPHPFRAGERLYRTGDLARFTDEGPIEFYGRVDTQVKIRGFRVELDEIRVVLETHPRIRQAVVRYKRESGGTDALIAWVTLASPPDEVDDVRDWAADRLPSYMVPTAWVCLGELPLTASGKIAYDRLPSPEVSAPTPRRAAPPESERERRMLGVWQEALSLPDLTLDDDFFAAGGNSLIAASITSRLNVSLSVRLSVRDLFIARTARKLAARIETAAAREVSVSSSSSPSQAYESAPLTSGQQEVWLSGTLSAGARAYNVARGYRLEGPLDVDALVGALHQVYAEHEGLRVRLVSNGPRPLQTLSGGADLQVGYRKGTDETVARTLEREAAYDFDLERDCLFRAQIVKIREHSHVLVLNCHHLVIDGWSLQILLREIAAHYADGVAGRELPTPLDRTDFFAYCHRQHDLWESGAEERFQSYWTERLAGVSMPLRLPSELGPESTDATAVTLRRTLTSFDTQRVAAICARGCTEFVLLLAAAGTALSRCARENDILVATPVHNREDPAAQDLVGCLAQVIPVRVSLRPGETVGELLVRLQEEFAADLAHHALPLRRILECIHGEGHGGAAPALRVSVGALADQGGDLALEGLSVSPIAVDLKAAKFDLSITFIRSRDGVVSVLESRAEILPRQRLEDLSASIDFVLDQMLADPATPLGAIRATTGSQAVRLVGMGTTVAPTPAEGSPRTIPERFAARAAERPTARALVTATGDVTYEDLAARVDRAATVLEEAGVTRCSRVGVLMERTEDLVTALLAVLEIGASYVPLDPGYPRQRLELICSVARPALMICSDRYRSLVDGLVPLRVADDLLRHTTPNEAAGGRRPLRGPTPADIAYVMFTSGSTGRPKAIAVTHRNTDSLFRWMEGTYGDPAVLEGVLASTSICFDLSVFEIFGTLACGGCVVLADNLLSLLDHPRASEVTLVNTVPSALDGLLNVRELPASVRVVNLAGEALSAGLVQRILARRPDVAVYNLYGPSEDTTYSTGCRVEAGDQAPPIGRPLPGTQALVLDEEGELSPPGAPGILHLAGDGLSMGYVEEPALTARAFVPNPFGPPGSRLYTTGDLVRWSDRGALLYLGREDHQVKLRGYRIELREIEAALLRLQGVREAAVVISDTAEGSRILVAYVSGEGQETTIQDRLGRVLPRYMVPERVLVVESFPRLPNGKTDRNALAGLPIVPAQSGGAESGGAERSAGDALSSVLEVVEAVVGRRLRPDQNLLQSGVNSLAVLQVISRVGELLLVSLDPPAVYRDPTPRHIAALVEEAAGRPSGVPAPVDGGSPIRRRILDLCTAHRIPGAQVELAYEGRRWSIPWGRVGGPESDPVTPETRFRPACNMKLFTSTGVLVAASRGAVDLDRPVVEYCADLQGTNLPADLSLRDLLSHRSGLDASAALITPTRFPSPEEFIRFVARELRPLSRPRTTYAYSMVDFVLAAYVAERATRTPWHRFLRHAVWEPLDMEPAFVADGVDRSALGLAADHFFVPGHAEARPTPPPNLYPHLVNAGTQGLYLRTSDLLRLVVEVREAAYGRGSRLEVSPMLAREALAVQTPIPGHPFMQAVGLGFTRFHNGTWGHIGNGRGHHSAVFIHPERNRAVAMQTNAYSSLPFFWEVCGGLFPDIEPPVANPGTELDSFEGTFRCAAFGVAVLRREGRLWLRVLEPLPEGFKDAPDREYEIEPLPGPAGMFSVKEGGTLIRGPVFFDRPRADVRTLRINLMTLYRDGP